ncbi:MAG: tRNA pseudouridine(38-40) synthase TruA [Acidobacteria bacterium]|nr:tRNA pseudouridine(38-40) synthase TruA [Acidobacteriota bacterium]
MKPSAKPAPKGANAAYRLRVEYEGGRFNGWQRQGEAQTKAGIRTVTGTLEHCLLEAGLRPLTLMGAGRTDAGVHALDQCAHLHLAAGKAPSPAQLQRLFDEGLPNGVAVREVRACSPAFHARHDAETRSYLYQICRRRSGLAKPFVWWVKKPLDLDRLASAWSFFEGFHAVTAFADLDKGDEPRCEIQRCEWMEHGSLILLRATASHFKRSQVRRMVGAAVACALGEAEPTTVKRDLAQPTREAALFWSERAAPSSGLFLERVQYKGEAPAGPLRPFIEVR